jgi:hypothetical protein
MVGIAEWEEADRSAGLSISDDELLKLHYDKLRKKKDAEDCA